jgi:glutaconyl-CoA/methylmalonyl-CoA decarboxylase subunit gamma
MARVTRLGAGVYRVAEDAAGNERQALVYVAGPRGNTWAFSNGRVYRPVAPEEPARRAHVPGAVQSLTSPMPATIVKVLAEPGQAVKAGDTLVIVEAMKMELPVRAPADAVVKAVHCKEKDIVQADQILVELE